jgi:hypothetical protein
MNADIEREVEAEAIVMVVMGEVGGKYSVVSHQTIWLLLLLLLSLPLLVVMAALFESVVPVLVSI